MPSPSSHPNAARTEPRKASTVVRRDTALFERHWNWLSAQSRGVDATLRLLVEEASRDRLGTYRAQQLKEACYFLMRDLAGDRPDFEAATRALFADDLERLSALAAAWPPTVASQILAKATVACSGQTPTMPGAPD